VALQNRILLRKTVIHTPALLQHLRNAACHALLLREVRQEQHMFVGSSEILPLLFQSY
jgi:hypothetical protein